MNPSADPTLAFFKTNREVRLERILRAFIALDDGDEPYWWKVTRSALIVDAKDELNAAPQALSKEIAGSDRAHPAIDPAGEPVAAATEDECPLCHALKKIEALKRKLESLEDAVQHDQV